MPKTLDSIPSIRKNNHFQTTEKYLINPANILSEKSRSILKNNVSENKSKVSAIKCINQQ
jgi:hypothetical protein